MPIAPPSTRMPVVISKNGLPTMVSTASTVQPSVSVTTVPRSESKEDIVLTSVRDSSLHKFMDPGDGLEPPALPDYGSKLPLLYPDLYVILKYILK